MFDDKHLFTKIVTFHFIKIENVTDRACLLIAQLSCKDNLIDEDYVKGFLL